MDRAHPSSSKNIKTAVVPKDSNSRLQSSDESFTETIQANQLDALSNQSVKALSRNQDTEVTDALTTTK